MINNGFPARKVILVGQHAIADDAEVLSDSDDEREEGTDTVTHVPFDGLSVNVQGQAVPLAQIIPVRTVDSRVVWVKQVVVVNTNTPCMS